MKRLITPSLLLCIVAVALLLSSTPTVGKLDAIAIWSGIQVYLQGGDPYDFQQLSRLLREHFASSRTSERFSNPPWAIPLLIPLFQWSFETSRFLLLVANLGAVAWCIVKLRRAWGPIPWVSTLPLWLYFPGLASLYCGQLSFLPLIGILFGIECVSSRETPWWKWCVAMLCLAIKPQGVYLAIVCLAIEFARRARGADIAKVVCVGGVFLAVVCPRPLSYLSSWSRAVEFLYTLKVFTLSTGLRDALELLGISSPISRWLLPISMILGSLLLRIRIQTPFELMITVLISCATAPYIWVYDFTALLPLSFLCLAALSSESISPLRRALGVVLSTITVAPLYVEFLPVPDPFFAHLCVVAALTIVAYPAIRTDRVLHGR